MKSKSRIDFFLLAPVILLVIISLVTLLSVQQTFFRNQLIYLIISGIAFFFFSQMHIDVLRRAKMPLYIASLIFLTVVLLLGIESRGAVRWLSLFGITIQFSEILKPFLAVPLP